MLVVAVSCLCFCVTCVAVWKLSCCHSGRDCAVHTDVNIAVLCVLLCGNCHVVIQKETVLSVLMSRLLCYVYYVLLCGNCHVIVQEETVLSVLMSTLQCYVLYVLRVLLCGNC